MASAAFEYALDMACRTHDRLGGRLIIVRGTGLVPYLTTTRENDCHPACVAQASFRAVQIHEYELHL